MDTTKPTYSLAKFKKLLCKTSSCVISRTARQGAVAMGYMDDDAIIDVVENIQEDEFYKTMPSITMPGLYQDVYYVNDGDKYLYIKIQIGAKGKKAIIIQFKNNEKMPIKKILIKRSN